jgi:hypothetical protein
MNDLLISLDKRNVAFLTLLDLSAAFDTINHSIFLKSLESTFGIKGLALSWFESYLTNRTQSVVVNGIKSETSVLHFGVSQGSVFGPVLFVMYMSPLFDVIKKYSLSQYAFADDNQLYTDSLTTNVDSTLCKMEECVALVKTLMTLNKLLLNESKTEALFLQSPHLTYSDEQLPTSLKIGESRVEFVASVCNLGVILDKHVDFSEHVHNVCQIAFKKSEKLAQFVTNNIGPRTLPWGILLVTGL